MNGLVARAALVVGVLGVLVLPAAGAADREAAVPPIGLSLDGERFTRTLDTPLFDPATTWVPGDRRTAVVHVRNQAPDDAEVAIEARRGEEPPPWLRVSAPDGALRSPLGPGETRRVPLVLTMADDAPRGAMGVSTDLALQVRLTEAVPEAPDGVLPDTGASVGPALLAVGLGLLAGGAAVLRARRRSTVGARP